MPEKARASGRLSLIPSSLSSSRRYLVAAAPASPILKLRGISSLARKGHQAGSEGRGFGGYQLPEHKSNFCSPPAPQEVSSGTSRAATLPWRCQDAAAPGPGRLQAATRSAQVSVATHGHVLTCSHNLDQFLDLHCLTPLSHP